MSAKKRSRRKRRAAIAAPVSRLEAIASGLVAGAVAGVLRQVFGDALEVRSPPAPAPRRVINVTPGREG